MIFSDRGSNIRVVQPTPPVITGFAGEIYQTPRLRVNIVHARCSDGMSDRAYPDRVQVDVDGRRKKGCGAAAMVPGGLAGTNWRVVAVNGRPTPAVGDFHMNFEASRFGAKFGCNGMGGDYRLDGDTIVPGPVMGTRMACPDMSFETDAGIVLSQPLRMLWTGGDRLRLSSGVNRTIDLVRSY
jgi:heat shock protein HslJ